MVETFTTKTVTQDRYVEIDESATEPVEVVELGPGPVGPYGLRAAFQACQVRTMQCNGQLSDIRDVEGKTVKE